MFQLTNILTKQLDCSLSHYQTNQVYTGSFQGIEGVLNLNLFLFTQGDGGYDSVQGWYP